MTQWYLLKNRVQHCTEGTLVRLDGRGVGIEGDARIQYHPREEAKTYKVYTPELMQRTRGLAAIFLIKEYFEIERAGDGLRLNGIFTEYGPISGGVKEPNNRNYSLRPITLEKLRDIKRGRHLKMMAVLQASRRDRISRN
jgi:hypothetical protein